VDTPPEETTDGQGSEPSCFQQQKEKAHVKKVEDQG